MNEAINQLVDIIIQDCHLSRKEARRHLKIALLKNVVINEIVEMIDFQVTAEQAAAQPQGEKR